MDEIDACTLLADTRKRIKVYNVKIVYKPWRNQNT